MRQHVLLFVNGERHVVTGENALLSLSDFLRVTLRSTGTKIVCEEGDCGSCSVLIGKLGKGNIRYKAIDSCIAFVFQLDGYHVLTVEGLSFPAHPDGTWQGHSGLSQVQHAMVENHGSQCGFCTPGFVVAMTGIMEDCSTKKQEPTLNDWRVGLTGNLCRCTGYSPILSACQHLSASDYQSLEARYPSESLTSQYVPFCQDDLQVVIPTSEQSHCVYSPVSLNTAIALKDANPDARLVAGATDAGVQRNKGAWKPQSILSLNRIDEMRRVEVTEDAIVFGSGVTWTDILPYCDLHFPQFREIVEVFGSPQIRNMGTIGGNIANASPIADSLPLYHVLECEIELASAAGRRWVNLNDFYLGYKKMDMKACELISRLRMPILEPHETLRLYKISRRRDMDISTFTAAMRFTIHEGTIQTASIAMGAVGPTVIRLRNTERFLKGGPFTSETMKQAGGLATEEIQPISDVRGSSDYRYQLSKNVFMKFYFDAIADQQCENAL